MPLKQRLIGAFMGTTALTLSVSPVLADELGFRDSQTLYMPSANVLITEKCVSRDNDAVCNMTIVNMSQSRYLEAEVTYDGADAESLDKIDIQINKSEFYSYNRGVGKKIVRSVEKERKTHIKARRDVPFLEDNYNRAASEPSEIEKAIQDTNLFSSLEGIRVIDDMSYLSQRGKGALEVSCKLIPASETEVGKFDLDIENASRAICVSHEYNQFEEKGATPYVKTTFSLYALNAQGQLVSNSIVDWKKMGDAPNGQISQQDYQTLDSLKQALGDNPYVFKRW